MTAACFGEGREYGLVLHLAYHDVRAALKQRLYSLAAQYAGQYAVVAGRGAASLDVPESSDAGLIVRYALLDLGGYLHCTAQVAS